MADCLFLLPTSKQRIELEAFRVKFEQEHGPTDLTRRYTSTWPKQAQQWLFENDQQSWFDGLPEFGRAYLKAKIEEAWSKHQPADRKPRDFIVHFMGREVRDVDDYPRSR